jgi:hypothetical protein
VLTTTKEANFLAPKERSMPRPMLYSSSSPTSSSVLFANAKGCNGARQYCRQRWSWGRYLAVLGNVGYELEVRVGLGAEERDR